MKLLIVEDEQVTREHLKTMLDFRKMGFTEVLLAANGEEGLKKALRSRPDVVLTDIRMPRMDGITMVEKLKAQLPDCQVVFLSAYAELEYYKAAIRLKTVSYVEKPVAPAELERVLTEAVKESQQKNMLARMRSREKLEKRKSLAYKLSLPNQRTEILKLMNEEVEGQTLSEYGYVTTMLLSFRHAADDELFLSELSDWVESRGQALIYSKNSEDCYIIQVLTRDIQVQFLRLVEEHLCLEITEGKEWYLSVGDTVTVGRSYQSYQTAAVGMQRCFFEPYGYVSYPSQEEIDDDFSGNCQKERQEILTAIGKFSTEECRELEASLFRKLQRQKSLVSGKIRGMYCDFFEAVFHEGESRQIPSADMDEFRQLIRKGEVDRQNFIELHETFIRLMQIIDARMKEQQGEASLILMIKKYVEDHYENPQFSLLEVAEYVHLSVSYICVAFKQGTDMTINQYLTQVRMEQAKKLLKSTRYSMTEISRMVGYQDSSYFGRIFKKTYQITPVEYRERKGTTT